MDNFSYKTSDKQLKWMTNVQKKAASFPMQLF